MLIAFQNNNELTAYEELNCLFDWNRTPMSPLGNIGAVYINLPRRAQHLHPPLRQSIYGGKGAILTSTPQIFCISDHKILYVWHLPP
jgi:hypothetical protein